ncbi:CAP domain-containing protein [Streptacidiphilus sp. PB12-B1b]|uniref:CAP domain-containing protein n=1 Tax=Streptacidiphilus sp. PB12-B1b TaxID=2705012 RepID=UPI0015FE7D21|nr:CAP domain-containing protein [Streptacidiphilus sp. PB12-B1b]
MSRHAIDPRIAAAVCGAVLAAGLGGLLGGLPATPADGGPGPGRSAAAGSPARTSVAASVAAAVPARAASVRVAYPAGRGGGVRQQILRMVNAERARHGCRALRASARLNRLAQDYSGEMAAGGFFGHTDPAGRGPWDRARALGVRNLGGENIAMGQPTPQAVMAAWMGSPGHRANILDCRYRSLGVGVSYAASGGPWWTQDFGF